MDVQTFTLTPFGTNCYVVADGGEAIVIDPGEPDRRLLEALEPLRVGLVINTHGHCDHCGGNAAVMEATGAPLAIHRESLPLLETVAQQARFFGIQADRSPAPSHFLDDGDVVELGRARFDVLYTPGHAPGHIVLYGEGALFCGDVLFAGSIGRTDLPGGDHTQLMASIRDKLIQLPEETIVYSGHGPATTMAQELRMNPWLTGL